VANGKRKSCYVASPCGFAESTKRWYKDLLDQLRNYVDIVDPWEENVDPILALPAEQRRDSWIELGIKHYRRSINVIFSLQSSIKSPPTMAPFAKSHMPLPPPSQFP